MSAERKFDLNNIESKPVLIPRRGLAKLLGFKTRKKIQYILSENGVATVGELLERSNEWIVQGEDGTRGTVKKGWLGSAKWIKENGSIVTLYNPDTILIQNGRKFDEKGDQAIVAGTSNMGFPVIGRAESSVTIPRVNTVYSKPVRARR